jgi:YD repeat-containing protein
LRWGSRGGTLAVQTVHPDSTAETRRYWLDSNGNVTWTGRRYDLTFPAPGELGTHSIHDLHNRLVRHEDLLTGVVTEYTYAPDLPDGSVSRNTATVVTTSGEGLVSSEEYLYHPSTDPPATRFKLMDHIRHTPSGAITLEHHTYVTAAPHPQNIGRPARVDYADGSYEEYTYSCCGLLTSRRRDGGITTHAYDDHGRLSSTTDPLGGVTSFGYTGLSSRQASITNDFGVVESFTYDGQGRRVRTDYTNGPLDGRHELSHYRADGRLSWSRSHSGVVTSNAYDTTTGDLLAVYVDGQLERSQTYDTLGRVETTTDARGLTLTRFYDTQGRLTHIIWPDSTFTETSYNAFGRVEYSNDRAGYTTWYEYDSMGRRTLVTPPDGIQRETTYRPSGEVEFTSIRPSTGEPALITGYEYDPLGRTSRIILPDGRERSYGYPDSFTRVETNEFGEVFTHVTAPGGASSWTLSSLGLVQSNRVSRGVGYVDYVSTGPDGRTTTNRVSQSGAHARTFYPDGGQSTVESGPFGPVRLVARDGAVTLRGYDQRGRLLTETNAVSDVLTYAYNSAGDLTDLWDWKGNHTQWQYDAEGRMAHKIYADGTQHDYTYHPAGTLESRTDALDRVTTYQYEFGRLKHIDYPSDPDVHYLYTPYGQPDTITRDASASQPAATIQYGYDLYQTRSSETSSFSSSLPVTLQYSGSRLLGYQVDDALPVDYGYDPLGRVSTVSRGTDTFTHTYDGQSARIAEITRNGLLHVQNQYDAMGRLDTRQNFANGQPVPDRSALFDYAHDAGDRRASVARADGSRIDYAYDPVGQVTGAVGVYDGGLTNRAYRFSYDYDPAGNPLERTRNGARREFVSNNLNQLTSATSADAVDVSGRFDGPIASVSVNSTPGAFLGDRWWAEQVSIAPGTNQLAAVITPPAAPAQTNTLSVVNAPRRGVPVRPQRLHDLLRRLDQHLGRGKPPDRNRPRQPRPRRPQSRQPVRHPLSRRTVKQVFVCTAPGQWTLVREHRFTWIDWLMVREYVTDMPQGLPPLQTVRDYVWGVDLSGTLQGAGAVGGLLAVVSTTAANPQPAVYYPGYDGNGNVCSATDAAGALAAAFEYDPFGNLLSAEGPAAAQIPFRFSTKYTDAETRLVYYGFRFCAPCRSLAFLAG